MYDPFLLCDVCHCVTQHYFAEKLPVRLRNVDGVTVTDHYRMKFACARCGTERVYGTERAVPKALSRWNVA